MPVASTTTGSTRSGSQACSTSRRGSPAPSSPGVATSIPPPSAASRSPSSASRAASSSRPRTGWASLTPTERELITYIGEGLDNRQIAARMHIAESTVRNNLTRIYDKLDIKGGRLGLLVYAYRHGLVKPHTNK